MIFCLTKRVFFVIICAMKMLGYLMLATPLIAMYVAFGIVLDFKGVSIVLISAIVLVAWLYLAACLINR